MLRRVFIITAITFLVLAASFTFYRWPRRPPVAEQVALVISPHPDDETYAMGQTVATQVAQGKEVIGVLVTDGEASAYFDSWAAETGSDLDSDGDIDIWDFGLKRRAEYRSAMKELGVTDLRFLGAAESQGETGLRDGEITTEGLGDVLSNVTRDSSVTDIFTVSAYRGKSPLAILSGDARLHPDHLATADAVSDLARAEGANAYYFMVYVHYRDMAIKKLSRSFVRGDEDAREAKSRAIQAYSGIGRGSTEALWNAASSDPDEYLAKVEINR